MTELELIQTDETIFFVNEDGKYLGGFAGIEPPLGAVRVDLPPPIHADQIWLFPGWAESKSLAVERENQWRDSEMPIAQENVTAIDFGEEDIPGTVQQWQKYWLALRKWTTDNPDFPDSSKRPTTPN